MKSKFTSLSLAEQDKSKTVKFFTDNQNGVTVCRLYDRWNDRYFTAKTRCHDVDVFDEKKGRAIAFNKARKKELLSDIVYLEQYQRWLTESYEAEMNALDRRLGLKHIYLAGVNDELDELLNGETTEVGEVAEFLNKKQEADDLVEIQLPEDVKETSDEDMPKATELMKDNKRKLTQFANFTEIEE